MVAVHAGSPAMTRATTVPHPSDMPFPALAPHHMAAPGLWQSRPVRVIEGATSYLGIKYAIPVGWRPLTLDLHLPRHRIQNTPVVVYAHGGSFIGGAREMGPWASLPGKGIAVATIDYRLSGEVHYPEPIEDVLAAIRWIRANSHQYGLDPHRIAGWGSSAGGYLMARAAFADGRPQGRPVGNHAVSARLSAVVLHYPVTDFSTILDDAFEPTAESQDSVVDVVSQFFGFPMADDPNVVAQASLAVAVSAASWRPPLHISHGDADHRCGLEQSRRLHHAVRAMGGDCALHVIADADHAEPIFNAPSVVDPALDFLQAIWFRTSDVDQTPLGTSQGELR